MMQASRIHLNDLVEVLTLTFLGRLSHNAIPLYLNLYIRFSVFGKGSINFELLPQRWYGLLSHTSENCLLKYMGALSFILFKIIIALCLKRLCSIQSNFNWRRISRDLIS